MQVHAVRAAAVRFVGADDVGPGARASGPGHGPGHAVRPRTTWKCGELTCCPAVMTSDIGFCACSTARWSLVVSPPRERPSPWSAGSMKTPPGGSTWRSPFCRRRPRALRAVRGLACGQDEHQRAAFPVGCEVDLAGLPALKRPRSAAFGRSSVAVGRVAALPARVRSRHPAHSPVEVAPFVLAGRLRRHLRHATAGSGCGRSTRRRTRPALPPLPARLEPPDHALELLSQPLGVRAVLADRQVRIDELPFAVGQLHSRHARRSSIPA